VWNLSLPWWHFVLRALIVYVFLIVILRVTGKRQTGQLAPFDLILLLVLSNAVQNSMNGGDNTVLGGLISASTLIGLHYVVAYITFKSKKMEAWIEGTPRMIVHNGVPNERVMRSEFLTHHELAAALRAAGCHDISHVHLAMLENNGQITVSIRPSTNGPRAPTEA
jgi:uncharacterized membrane protein YcaP (DUF421 family)